MKTKPLKLERKIYDESVVWTYGRVLAYGVEGLIDREVEEVGKICESLGLEIAYTNKEEVIGIQFMPSCDITINFYPRGLVDILAFSTNRQNAEKLVSTIQEKADIVAGTPSQRFLKSAYSSVLTATQMLYEMIKLISAVTKMDEARLYGVSFYADFLQRFKNVPRGAIYPEAFKKFGLECPQAIRNL